MPWTGCLLTSGSAFPPAPGPANCPDVGPTAKVFAGISANPTSSVAAAVERKAVLSAANSVTDVFETWKLGFMFFSSVDGTAQRDFATGGAMTFASRRQREPYDGVR